MKSRDYFSLFALPVEFNIDIAALTSRYFELQKSVHPDKFANAAEQERLYSVQQTAQLNDAYNTLKKPVLRARYLLALQGIDLNDETNTVMDGAFLMQQMTLREAIGEAKTDIDALEAVIDQIAHISQMKLSDIKVKFAESAPAFEEIAAIVREMQFFQKLREDADQMAIQLENNERN